MFSDSYGSMLDTSLLESYHSLPASARHWWLGADIGRKHDKTAIASITQDNGIVYVDSIDVLDKVEYQAQLDKMAALDKAKHYTRGYIDEGGIGSMVAEQACKAISPKLKGLAFTSSSKTPMFEAIRDLAFRHKLKFRDSIIELAKADMQQVSRIVTADGNVRY